MSDYPIEYRDIPGYPGYRVGSDGSVWSQRNFHGGVGGPWRLLRPRPNASEHLRVTLSTPTVTRDRFVHILVLEAFVGPCPSGMECCHGDGNPKNNNLSNL